MLKYPHIPAEDLLTLKKVLSPDELKIINEVRRVGQDGGDSLLSDYLGSQPAARKRIRNLASDLKYTYPIKP